MFPLPLTAKLVIEARRRDPTCTSPATLSPSREAVRSGLTQSQRGT